MAKQWNQLSEMIDRAERQGIDIGVAIIGPDGGLFEHRGDDVLKAASTIKIAIMITLFGKIDRGEVSLDDPYRLKADDKAPGSGILQNMHDGIGLTLGDVVYLMMSISDNPATNILIDTVGIDNVNATMRDLGLERSILGRKMRGRPAQETEQENLATASEFALMVESIMDHQAASPESCVQMIALLEKQQNARRIGRYVPEGVRWGTKTGSYGTVANDVGFVESDSGRVIISVLTGDLPDMFVGEKLIGDIAREAMRETGVAEPLTTS